MQKQQKEKLSAFNISFFPPASISRKIMSLSKKLKRFWDEEYTLDSAHLTLYYTVIPERNVPKLKSVVSEYTKSMKPITITLGDMFPGDNYIMIKVKNADKIRKIHDDLVSILSPIREGAIMEKYIRAWGTFSKEKKGIIIKTGHQYPYEPHMTISKIKGDMIDKAWNVLKGADFKGASFSPKSVYLSIGEEGSSIREGKGVKSTYRIGK